MNKDRKRYIEGLEGLARREAFLPLSEKPIQIEPKPPWEIKGVSMEEYLKNTSTTLYRSVISLENADPEYLMQNYQNVLSELSKVVEMSGHFLLKKESDKIKGIMASLTKQLEGLKNESQSADTQRISSSSGN